MRKIWVWFLSYVAVFMLGAYSSSQIVYNDPIPTYKWVSMIFVAIVALLFAIFDDKLDK